MSDDRYYFRACYVHEAADTLVRKKGDYIAILELTELGKQQNRIVIPNYINGKPVVQIGMIGLGYKYSLAYGMPTYKKIYLPKEITSIMTSIGSSKAKVFAADLSEFKIFKEYNGTIYLEERLHDHVLGSNNSVSEYCIIRVANLTYMSNNNVFFIDDYADGEKIDRPPEPIENGKVFLGWYADPKCTIEWDFDNDTFHLEENSLTMKLYAKWND